MCVSQPYLRHGFVLTGGNGPMGPVASLGMYIPDSQLPAACQYTMIPPTYNGMRLSVAPDGVPMVPPPTAYDIGLNNYKRGPPPAANFGIPETSDTPRIYRTSVGSSAEADAIRHVNAQRAWSATASTVGNNDSLSNDQRRDARTYPSTSQSGPGSASPAPAGPSSDTQSAVSSGSDSFAPGSGGSTVPPMPDDKPSRRKTF